MATLADSLVSSASRPLRLRTRPDLSVRQHRYHGRAYWVVKEPVGLNYFRFHEEEFAILQMLDGVTSMEEIKERFEREFAPQKITFQDLQQFIGMLHRSGLVISDAPGQGRQLKRRRDEKKRKELLGKMTNVFAVRFRGFDPERLFNVLIPYTSWIFSPAAIIFTLLLGLSALTLVAVQFDVFRSRLPSFHEFFGPHNWIYLGVTMAAVKVLHEFGHGLSCKRYGGECHELGVMLLVFTPCLYCNVSDSWMLPNKWHRAFIGAAGIYVEVILASIATFIWWFSEPGTMINQICLSMMFICSVSTILFNGNPLLRFDGYYILMDVLEIPNLRQKATEVLKRFVTWLCLGIEQPENPFLPQRHHFFFGLYTVAAVIYRWVVVFSILYFMNKVFEPYGLKIIGRMIGAIGFFGLVVQPLYQLGKFFYMPGRMHKVKRYRLVLSGVVLLAVIGFILLVPLPHQVQSVFTVKPRGAVPVYPRVDGRLVEITVQPGDRVEAQQKLGRIENVELQLQLEQLNGDKARLQVQLDNLRDLQLLRGRGDDLASGQKAQIEAVLRSVEKEIAQVQREIDQLDILAPVAGMVLQPEYRPSPPSSDGRLPSWTGSPLSERNLNSIMTKSDLFCRIGEPDQLEAELILDQSVIDFIREGQKVELKFEALPHEVFEGTIGEIGLDRLEVAPPSLTAQGGGGLETVSDPSTGLARPLHASYPARVELPREKRLQVGMKGYAKIHADWIPLGHRLYRYIAKTFHFEF